MIELDIQRESDFANQPSDEDIYKYVQLILGNEPWSLTVRFVEKAEIQALNRDFRGKDKPTNVLSFPFEMPEIPDCDLKILGDVIICLDVVEEEATAQGKNFEHHFAHMVIHGILHLLGYDHIKEEDTFEMESKEIALLATLGIANPYGE